MPGKPAAGGVEIPAERRRRQDREREHEHGGLAADERQPVPRPSARVLRVPELVDAAR